MKKTALILISVAIGAIASANDTTNLKFVGTGIGRNDINIKFDSHSENVFAGQLKHSFTGGVGSLEWLNGKTISTYCSEPTQTVTSTRSQYERVGIPQLDPHVWSVNGAAKTSAIESLFNAAYGSVTSAATTRDMAAAFQIAVWKIGYDYDGTAASLNMSSGRFHASLRGGSALDTGLQAQLNNFFGAAQKGSQSCNVIALHSDCSQDQLTTVPEPATMAALGVGLAGILRRRRQKKA